MAATVPSIGDGVASTTIIVAPATLDGKGTGIGTDVMIETGIGSAIGLGMETATTIHADLMKETISGSIEKAAEEVPLVLVMARVIHETRSRKSIQKEKKASEYRT